jgi:uncharacterized protein (DUF1778 family)
MPRKEKKTVTITMRVSPEHEARIKAAAAADNRTVSNFLVTAGLREAEEVLRRVQRGRTARPPRGADDR